MKRLPKGRLFSSRRYGRYGNYITWKMLKALAILMKPPSDKTPQWTSRKIGQEVEMAQQSALLMLERMKKKNWVEWDRDGHGRQAWVITPLGRTVTMQELHRRINFEVAKHQPECLAAIHYVERGIMALKKLKFFGWYDIQARECLINYQIHRIEWGIAKAERRLVENKGAYARVLIEQGNQNERRCRVYVQRVAPDMPENTRETLVKESLRMANPFRSAVWTVTCLTDGHKSTQDLTPNDVGNALFDLCKLGKIKHKPRHYFAEGVA